MQSEIQVQCALQFSFCFLIVVALCNANLQASRCPVCTSNSTQLLPQHRNPATNSVICPCVKGVSNYVKIKIIILYEPGNQLRIPVALECGHIFIHWELFTTFDIDYYSPSVWQLDTRWSQMRVCHETQSDGCLSRGLYFIIVIIRSPVMGLSTLNFKDSYL